MTESKQDGDLDPRFSLKGKLQTKYNSDLTLCAGFEMKIKSVAQHYIGSREHSKIIQKYLINKDTSGRGFVKSCMSTYCVDLLCPKKQD